MSHIAGYRVKSKSYKKEDVQPELRIVICPKTGIEFSTFSALGAKGC